MDDHYLEKRISSLEERLTRIDIERAAENVDRKHLDRRLDGIETAINSSKDALTWLNRTIYGAIIVAVITFIFKNGLT